MRRWGGCGPPQWGRGRGVSGESGTSFSLKISGTPFDQTLRVHCNCGEEVCPPQDPGQLTAAGSIESVTDFLGVIILKVVVELSLVGLS